MLITVLTYWLNQVHIGNRIGHDAHLGIGENTEVEVLVRCGVNVGVSFELDQVYLIFILQIKLLSRSVNFKFHRLWFNIRLYIRGSIWILPEPLNIRRLADNHVVTEFWVEILFKLLTWDPRILRLLFLEKEGRVFLLLLVYLVCLLSQEVIRGLRLISGLLILKIFCKLWSGIDIFVQWGLNCWLNLRLCCSIWPRLAC